MKEKHTLAVLRGKHQGTNIKYHCSCTVCGFLHIIPDTPVCGCLYIIPEIPVCGGLYIIPDNILLYVGAANAKDRKWYHLAKI